MAAAGWSARSAYLAQLVVTEEIEQRRSVAQRPSRTIDPGTVTAVNQAIRQLNLPWKNLLATVEEAARDRVALLSLEPEASQRLLRLSGEARNADEMIDFVERVGKTGFLSQATLLRHEINESDRNRPFRFVVEAKWAEE